MQDGKLKKIIFVMPFVEMVSNYVRALCLEGYETRGWNFIFTKGMYPIKFDKYVLRTLYRYYYYISEIRKCRENSSSIVVYFIKPNSPLLIFIIKYLLGMKIMVDVNDPYHLPELLGFNKTKKIFKYADKLIFESEEYANYWNKKYGNKIEIISDTPQHECIYLNSNYRNKSVIWVGSIHTAQYLLQYKKYFELFSEYGYEIKFLGVSKNIFTNQFNRINDYKFIENYNVEILAHQLSSSLISFIPMPDEDLFNLRGNLKAKISMGYGCLTIVSNLEMHKKIINHGVNGYLFDDFEDFEKILINIENRNLVAELAYNGNNYVSNKYTRQKQADKIIKLAEELMRH